MDQALATNGILKQKKKKKKPKPKPKLRLKKKSIQTCPLCL